MKHPIVATTTSRYYLDKSLYCVKLLKLSRTKRGFYKWFVSRTFGMSADRETCITHAIATAAKNDIIYVPYATHGRNPSVTDLRRLDDYGLLSRQKYSTKELPWD